MLRHVEGNDKRWEEGEMVCQGKRLSGAIRMKAVHLKTLERKSRSERLDQMDHSNSVTMSGRKKKKSGEGSVIGQKWENAKITPKICKNLS